MEQSNESNLRALEFFRNNTSSDNHQDWEKWAEKYQLTFIAEESLDFEDVINSPVRSELLYSVPEASESSDDQNCRPKKKIDTNKHYKPAMKKPEPLYVNNEPTSNIEESQKCRKFCSQEFEEV